MRILVFVCSIVSFFSSAQTLCLRDQQGEVFDEVKIGVFYADGTVKAVYPGSNGCLVLDTVNMTHFIVRSDYNEEKRVPIPNDFPMVLTFNSGLQNLDQVTVTANYREALPQECVLSVETITAEKIAAMGAQNVADVLRQSLNFRVGSDPVLGNTISFQGMGGEKVKVMIDGVPVVGRLNGQIDLSQIVTSDIEKIEIVEGPLSVDYGTDALAGTINIITKSGRTNGANAFTQYESSGVYNAGLSTTLARKRKQLSVGISRNFFDGWRDADLPFHIEKKTVADSTRIQPAKPKEAYNAHWKGRLINETGKLDMSIRQNYYEDVVYNWGEPAAPYGLTAFDEEYLTRRLDQQFQIKDGPKSEHNFNFLAAYNYYERTKNTWVNDLQTLERTLTPQRSDQDTTLFHAWMSRGNWSFGGDSARHHVTVGYDVYHHTMTGQRILNERQEIYNTALFTVVESNITKKFDTRLGLRGAYNSAYGPSAVPSAAGRWNWKNDNRMTFGFGTGFRAPELKELYLEFVDVNHNIVGNTDLVPEISMNVFWMHEKKWKKDDRVIELTGRAFANRVQNGIALAQSTDGQTFTYRNLTLQETAGFQIRTGYFRETWKIEADASLFGQNLPDRYADWVVSPEVSANLTYIWKRRNVSFNWFYRHNGALRVPLLMDDEVVFQVQNGIHWMDFSVQKEWFKGKFNLQLGAKNLLNVRRVNFGGGGAAHSSATGSLLGFGRVYYMKLSSALTWKK